MKPRTLFRLDIAARAPTVPIRIGPVSHESMLQASTDLTRRYGEAFRVVNVRQARRPGLWLMYAELRVSGTVTETS